MIKLSGVVITFNEAKNIASTVKDVVNPDNFNFDFSGMFSNLASGVNGCFTGPVLCGPPRVEFFGGGGRGVSANAIVSAAGEILGVDIITPGSGYSRAPFVNIVDDCGKEPLPEKAILESINELTNVVFLKNSFCSIITLSFFK